MIVEGFYTVTELIKDQLQQIEHINKVTYGDFASFSVEKNEIYPVANFLITSVEYQGSTVVYNISLLVGDLIDISNEDKQDDFTGNDNTHDIFNTQGLVIQKLHNKLKSMRSRQIELIDFTAAEPFMDKHPDNIAGWTVSFSLAVRNDISIC